MDSLDASSLVAALIERKPWAQRIVWHALTPMVRRMCTRALPGGEIDDLVQDVFLVLFRRVHALRNPRALKAFVITVTKREIRAARRRMASDRAIFLSETLSDATGPADFDARRAVHRLHEILCRLHAIDRDAFVLSVVEGHELDAVALALGASVSTVKRRIARAWTRVTVHAGLDVALDAYIARRPARRRRLARQPSSASLRP